MKTPKFLICIFIFFFAVTFSSFGQDTKKEGITIKDKNIKSGTYTSKSDIKVTGTIKGGTEQVIFKAKEGIILKSGFSSEKGSDLLIKIEEDEVENNSLKPKREIVSHSINVSPNPYKYSTTIFFSLPKKEFATISIYDEKDNLIKQILKQEKEAGNHEVDFKEKNLSSGVYKVVLKTSDAILVQKMIVVQ